MAKLNLLKAKQVANLKEPGIHADGSGLYLQVAPSGSKSWLYRFRWQAKRPEIGLGSYPSVSLADARARRDECRAQIQQGIFPGTKRQSPTATPTFADCARQFIADKQSEWRNTKHRAQWAATLETYAFPVIGNKPVNLVALDDMLGILRPIWESKTETASRVRGRLERVLSWAIVKGHRAPPNPAIWRGNLAELMSKPSKVADKGHHAALPWSAMPQLWAEIARRQSISALALQLCILTTTRTGEVIAARWPEFDLEAQTWTIPASRMKAGREHRVPLTKAATAVLERLERKSEYLFPGLRSSNPHMSNMAMLLFLKRDLQRPDLTVHGFRSSFKDWAAEATAFPGELSEAQLAHIITNKAQAAYERGDKLERRRELLESWSDYLSGTAKILAFRRAG